MGFGEAFRLAAGNIVSDYYHAARDGVLGSNLVGIPTFRAGQFLGTYQGFRQRGEVPAVLRRRFYYPRGFRRPAHDRTNEGAREPIHYEDAAASHADVQTSTLTFRYRSRPGCRSGPTAAGCASSRRCESRGWIAGERLANRHGRPLRDARRGPAAFPRRRGGPRRVPAGSVRRSRPSRSSLLTESTIAASSLQARDIPEGTERLLLKTRNSSLWHGRDRSFRPDFVALTVDAAAWVVARGIRLVGIDYLSIQRFDDGPETHRTLFRGGVTILEGLDLTGVRPGRYTLACLPLRAVGVEAAPVRAVLLPDDERAVEW